jgi:hypothetical protein
MLPQPPKMSAAANNVAAPQQQPKKDFKIIGLEGVNLKDATKVDLKQLEVGQGYVFTVLGFIQAEGQYGVYYTVGVQDLNGNLFKFFSNSQINKMIENNEIQIGQTYWFISKLKPGMTYQNKQGEQEVKGYIYDIYPYEAPAVEENHHAVNN